MNHFSIKSVPYISFVRHHELAPTAGFVVLFYTFLWVFKYFRRSGHKDTSTIAVQCALHWRDNFLHTREQPWHNKNIPLNCQSYNSSLPTSRVACTVETQRYRSFYSTGGIFRPSDLRHSWWHVAIWVCPLRKSTLQICCLRSHWKT